MKKFALSVSLLSLILIVAAGCQKRNDDQSLYHMLPGSWTLTHAGPDTNGNAAPDPEELTQLDGTLPIPVTIRLNKNLTGEARISYTSYSLVADFVWGLEDKEQVFFTAMGLDTSRYIIHSFDKNTLTVFDTNIGNGVWERYVRQ